MQLQLLSQRDLQVDTALHLRQQQASSSCTAPDRRKSCWPLIHVAWTPGDSHLGTQAWTVHPRSAGSCLLSGPGNPGSRQLRPQIKHRAWKRPPGVPRGQAERVDLVTAWPGIRGTHQASPLPLPWITVGVGEGRGTTQGSCLSAHVSCSAPLLLWGMAVALETSELGLCQLGLCITRWWLAAQVGTASLLLQG